MTAETAADVPAIASDNAVRGMRAASPVMAVVFAAFLDIGMALPVPPRHVHQALGVQPFAVGLVRLQLAAALASRLWAGRLPIAGGRGLRC